MGCALEFKHVRFAYGEGAQAAAPVLHDVSFAVGEGTCVCVTGPSGCGKTTLTRLVNGLIPSFYEGTLEGEVTVDGRNVADWDLDDLCRTVGSVFQNPRSQFFNLDTTSELAYGCENLGVDRDEMIRRIALVAEELGLRDLVGRNIRDLSGGQRQLLSLGAACAMGAEAFVLDEPTANLDAAAVRLVKRALQTLKRQGKTILVIEHRLHWLDGLADRVVHVEAGRVAGDYSAAEFSRLSADQLAEKGLRAWSLASLSLAPAAGAETATGAEPAAGTDAERAAAGTAPAAAAPVRPFDLQANGLRAGYSQRREVLKGASFSVTGGHATAIIGRNGQGKSTLARVVAGLTQETYGGIALNAKPLSANDRAGSVYLVFQEPGYQLFAPTVRGEFAVGRRKAERSADAQVSDLIERFGLAGKEERHPASLSGGEKQRLALAVGISAGARVLVLDEPTSGLDRASMDRCAREIRGLVQEGRCVLVITHDVELVAAACDGVIEVDAGRVRRSYDLDVRTFPRVLELLAPAAAPSTTVLTRPRS